MSDLTNHIGTDNHKKLLDQLKRHEGTRRNMAGLHVAYRCTAGALTIGYGHNLDARPIAGITAKSALTEEEAMRILNTDVDTTWGDLKKALPWINLLSPVRISVLINMAFNMGVGNKRNGLLSFVNTLENIRGGNYEAVYQGMIKSKWARQVGNRALELAEQMKTGRWPIGGAA